jgi:hypothetical protein
MKELLANLALIAVGLLWVIGVDSMPFMKVLGLPLFICAMAYWIKHSRIAKRVMEIMDDGLRGRYDYYEE